MNKIKEKLIKELTKLTNGKEVINIVPTIENFGEYSCNVAFEISKRSGLSPAEIAHKIMEEFSLEGFSCFVAGGGFLNFKASDLTLLNQIDNITLDNMAYGTNTTGEGKKVNVEFVSANPTGPLHIGNARGGPLGDVLAHVLQKSGYKVTREYYHNDLGEQVRKLGESILYHIKLSQGVKMDFPEGGYEGDYVKELATKIADSKDPAMTATHLGSVAVGYFFQDALEVCKSAEINFDVVSKESDSNTAKAVNLLKEAKATKEKDGAEWFFADDEFLKDRECVLVKSDGKFTYFANDIAYHLDKKDRGFDISIDVWGANHSGHIPRMQAALATLGASNFLKVILYQWVSLIREGKEVGMSKRKGNFITAKEVIAEVGKDAFRWFFLDKDCSSHIKFDLDLAKERSNRNPVFYVQYAYARMCSLLSKSHSGQAPIEASEQAGMTGAERSLVRELIYFPDIVEDISKTYKVHELTSYAMRLADKFHKFYESCPIIGDSRERERLAIVRATKIVLKNTLDLLGISTPEKM